MSIYNIQWDQYALLLDQKLKRIFDCAPKAKDLILISETHEKVLSD